MSKTKILFLTVALFAIALSGCSSFDSKEAQTSVVTIPEGQIESYKIKVTFSNNTSNHLVTMTHKESGGDQFEVSYNAPDYNGDGVYDWNDCKGDFGFYLHVNRFPMSTAYAGKDPAISTKKSIWVETTPLDGQALCKTTTFHINDFNDGDLDGTPLSLALSDKTIDVNATGGIPGVISYGTTSSPTTSWNITPDSSQSNYISAELELLSNYGECDSEEEWNDETGQCEEPVVEPPVEPVDDPSDILGQNIVCYHNVNEGTYKGDKVKCGDVGCIYPDNTYCRNTGCYNMDGTSDIPEGPMWETVADFSVCEDSSGNVVDGGGNECPDDVQVILGDGCHDMDSGVWFNGEMTKYIVDGDYSNQVIYCNDEWNSGCDYEAVYGGGDEGYCETAEYEDETCTTCWDSENNQTSHNCHPRDDGTQPPETEYCFVEGRGEEDCEVCYDSEDNVVSEDCWWVGGGDTSIADEHDAQRQKDDMLDSIRNSNRDIEKHYPKFKKEMERFLNKELKKKLGKYEKLLKRSGDAPRATSILNEAINWTENRQIQVTGLIADIEEVISSCQSGMDIVESKVNAIVPGEATWDDLNAGWSSMRRYVESCWPQKNAIEAPFRSIEQGYYEFSDMIYEITKAVIEMESYGVSIPSFIDKFLEEYRELNEWADRGLQCKDNVLVLVEVLKSSTDQDDIDYAQEDVWDAEQDCNWERDDMYDAFDDWREGDSYDSPHPWERYVDKAWRTMDDQRYVEEDKRELEKIRDSIEGLANIRNEIETDDPFVLEHIKNLEDLRDKALPMVLDMILAAEKGDYVEWEQLELVGNVADKSMEVIARYCDDFPNRCWLSGEVEEMIYGGHYGGHDGPHGGPHGGPPYGIHDDFEGVYFEEELVDRIVNQIVSRLEEEIIAAFTESFTRLFTETMADKIATHMEGESGEVLSNVFNNIEYLGDDRTKIVAENSTSLYDVLTKFEDYEINSDVASVIDSWHETVVAASLKDEVINKFEELLTAVRNGSETGPIVASLWDKHENNDRLLATEDKVQFLDAKLKDNDWYYGSFMGSSFTGDSDSQGRLTGFVRPAGLINRCEALKIVIEAAGINKAPGTTDWWCSSYQSTAEQEEFNMVGWYGDSAYWVPPSTDRGYLAGNPNRAELCRLFVQAGNLEYTRYDNEFPDINYLDPWAEDAATCLKYGIITGQGNGNFDPHSQANRAEVAAMEVRFKEAIQASQLFNSL